MKDIIRYISIIFVILQIIMKVLHCQWKYLLVIPTINFLLLSYFIFVSIKQYFNTVTSFPLMEYVLLSVYPLILSLVLTVSLLFIFKIKNRN